MVEGKVRLNRVSIRVALESSMGPPARESKFIVDFTSFDRAVSRCPRAGGPMLRFDGLLFRIGVRELGTLEPLLQLQVPFRHGIF